MLRRYTVGASRFCVIIFKDTASTRNVLSQSFCSKGDFLPRVVHCIVLLRRCCRSTWTRQVASPPVAHRSLCHENKRRVSNFSEYPEFENFEASISKSSGSSGIPTSTGFLSAIFFGKPASGLISIAKSNGTESDPSRRTGNVHAP